MAWSQRTSIPGELSGTGISSCERPPNFNGGRTGPTSNSREAPRMVGFLSCPALDLDVFSAAITCVRIHQDFSLFWVTLLPHARLFPGLNLGRSIWLGDWALCVWSWKGRKDGVRMTKGPIKGDGRSFLPPKRPSPPSAPLGSWCVSGYLL